MVDNTKLLKIGLPLLSYRGNRTGPYGPSSGEVKASVRDGSDGDARGENVFEDLISREKSECCRLDC